MESKLKENLEELSSEEAELVRNILNEPHLSERELKKLVQQRRFHVIPGLSHIFGEDDKTKNILYGIKVDEELRRIRYGYECATCLPESYVDAVKNTFGKWGLISFYRGRWEIKNPDLSEDLPRLSMRHIRAGSDKLKKAFQINPLISDFNEHLKMQWNRINNSYNAMFGYEGTPKNYYEW